MLKIWPRCCTVSQSFVQGGIILKSAAKLKKVLFDFLAKDNYTIELTFCKLDCLAKLIIISLIDAAYLGLDSLVETNAN